MNLKNTAILLIFLLAVLGLIVGVHYTEDEKSNSNEDNKLDSIDEDDSSVTAIDITKMNNELKEFLKKDK
ncbi:hypothetical protein [Methanobrevibacter sp.]|uniref:hypothetical protein n=1 Tax=Methanobrevibacter sp. TaxID=66852 RepID=UPI003869D2A9